MNDLEYQKQAAVTLSHEFHGDVVGIGELFRKLDAAIAALNQLDAMKKLVFYGRGVAEIKASDTWEAPEPWEHIGAVFRTKRDEVIFHCLLGIATEAGEGLEQLVNTLRSRLDGSVGAQLKEFDFVNIVEESGDALWYHGNLANELGQNMGDWKQTNINKLRKRFAAKFDAFEANNRDLKAERDILEGQRAVNVELQVAIEKNANALEAPVTLADVGGIPDSVVVKADSFKVDGVELAQPHLYDGHPSLADMIVRHLEVWKSALEYRKIIAQADGNEENVSYNEHELRALAKIKAAVVAELRQR